MARSAVSSREPRSPLLLSGLTGILPAAWVIVFPGIAGFFWLLASEKSAMALLILGLPMDRFLALDIAGFTIRLSHLATLILSFRLLLNSLTRSGQGWHYPSPVFLVPLTAFALLLAAGLLRTYNPLKSLGYFGWAVFDIFLLIPVLVSFANSIDRVLWVTRVFLIGQLLTAAYGLIQVAGHVAGLEMPFLAQLTPSGWPRLNAFHYEPQYYAFYSLMALSLLGYGWLKGTFPIRGTKLNLLIALLTTSAFLSTSRSGWLALILLALLGVIFAPLRSLRRWILIGAVSVAVAGGVVAFPQRLQRAVVRLGSAAFDPHEPMSTAPRLQTFREGWKMIRENWVLGVGIGNYGATLHEDVWKRRAAEETRSQAWHAAVPANMWIELLAETGVIGVALFLFLLFVLSLEMGRAARRFAGTSIASLIRGYRLALWMTFFVMYQFAQTLYRLDTWFLIGLAIALCRIPPPSQAGRDFDGSRNPLPPRPA